MQIDPQLDNLRAALASEIALADKLAAAIAAIWNEGDHTKTVNAMYEYREARHVQHG